MIDLLIVNAGELVTCQTAPNGAIRGGLRSLHVVEDGAVAIDEGKIVELGRTAELRQRHDARHVIDAQGMLVSPGLVDPHSHLVYGGSRHEEYETLITGERDPGKRLGGGIRYTVSRTRAADDLALRAQALADLDTMLQYGTTTMEAKSGYGLDHDTEMRLLRVAASLDHPIDIFKTYLGAHVVPEEYRDRRDEYVNLVIGMLEEARPYADYCDVCCDPIGFTVEECARIAERAAALGYRLKVHADQTGPTNAAELAARLRATSADHLDYISEAGMRMMAESGTVGVLLPGVTFHMMEMIPKLQDGELIPASKPFMPQVVRQMIQAGMRLALSADYNPGSCPTQSMQIVMQLAARLYRLNYAEIWHMSTINAAHALDCADRLGSVEVGKQADLVIWRVPKHGMVINRFGVNLVGTVLKKGQVVVHNGRRV